MREAAFGSDRPRPGRRGVWSSATSSSWLNQGARCFHDLTDKNLSRGIFGGVSMIAKGVPPPSTDLPVTESQATRREVREAGLAELHIVRVAGAASTA